MVHHFAIGESQVRMNVSTTIPGRLSPAFGPRCGEVGSFRNGVHLFRLYCLKDIEEIRAAKNEWQALEQTSTEAFTYFQSFDWCYTWCVNRFEHDSLHRQAELYIYLLRCDDAVVLIWPMMAVKTRVGARILTYLTDPLGQYANLLIDRRRVSDDVGSRVWKRIRKHANVDAVTINHYPHDSFLAAILCGMGFVERSNIEASVLDLSGFQNWNDHHASLSRNQRKQRNRRRCKLKKQGNVTYEVTTGSDENYSKYVSLALEMKLVWLGKTGRKPGILGDPKIAGFLADLAGSSSGSQGCPAGAVAHALCLNGKPIAIEIGMILGRHYYSYLGAFDWDWKDYSPGKIQIEAAQKWAKAKGLAQFDFLGDPSDYKQEWTNTSHRLLSKSMPITALGLIYCAIWKSRLRPKLKIAYKNMATDRKKLLSRIVEFTGRSNDRYNYGPEPDSDGQNGNASASAHSAQFPSSDNANAADTYLHSLQR